MNTHRRLPFLAIAALTLAALLALSTIQPTHAAPLLQKDDEATLLIVNDAEDTICGMMACATVAVTPEDCAIANDEMTLRPGESHAFDIAPGEYNIALVDCENNVLMLERAVTVVGSYELRLTSPDSCAVVNLEAAALYRDAHYAAALQRYQEALACYREAHNRAEEANILNALGFIYDSLGQYGKALEHYEQALTIRREINDRIGEGVSLNNIGGIYDSLGQYPEALDYYQQALTLNREMDDRGTESATLNNIGSTYDNLGDYTEALRHYEQALTIRRETHNRPGEGTTLSSIGSVYSHLGQYMQALDYFEQALVIRREVDDQAGESTTLNNIGSVYFSLGEYAQALEYYQQALTLSQRLKAPHKESTTLNNIGLAYYHRGQYAQALDHCRQALEIQQVMGDRAGEAGSLNNLGAIHASLGQYTHALDYYEQTLHIHREIGHQAGEGFNLNNIGDLYASQGHYTKALDYYQQALVLRQEIGDRANEGADLYNIGSVYDSLGQPAKALSYYEQALDILREVGNRLGEGTTLNGMGGAHASLAQYTKALAYYEQALNIRREIGDRAGESSTLYNLGLAYRKIGDPTPALDYYAQAIGMIEMLRGELGVEEHKSSFAAEYTDMYEGIISLLLHVQRPEDAFHYAQRAKARTFLDQIGNTYVDPRTTNKPELLEQEHTLLTSIHTLEAILARPNDHETAGAPHSGELSALAAEQRQALQTRLDSTYREYERLLATIKSTNPEYADLRAVDVSTLITVQQTLPAQTTLVEYYVVSDTQTLAFVVTLDAFHTVPLSVSVASLIQKVDWFRQFTSEEATRATAQMLYNWLFAPVRKYIDTPAVLFAPHQQLHYLPFEALHDGAYYLVETYTIGYIPSASVLRYLNVDGQDDAKDLLVLGNPTNNAVPSLPAADQEAQVVAEMFGASVYLGESATESRLWEQAADADYIHLAAHGQFNETAPQFSRVYLAPSETARDTVTPTLSSHTDGLLETHEVWNLQLENADLVTLSACQTQLGELSAGDELVGLSRAFIYAGTPSLVASLWSVEDASTAYLMERFYGYLKEGMSKAEALRQAKLDTLETYPSPYHWAAFTLIGDMGAVNAERVQHAPSETPSADTNGGTGICPGVALPLALGTVAGYENQRRKRRKRR